MAINFLIIYFYFYVIVFFSLPLSVLRVSFFPFFACISLSVSFLVSLLSPLSLLWQFWQWPVNSTANLGQCQYVLFTLAFGSLWECITDETRGGGAVVLTPDISSPRIWKWVFRSCFLFFTESCIIKSFLLTLTFIPLYSYVFRVVCPNFVIPG